MLYVTHSRQHRDKASSITSLFSPTFFPSFILSAQPNPYPCLLVFQVLLDVSPPELNAVVLQGNLIFDDSIAADQELLLRCKFILVNGGSLSVGTPEKPFGPGKARITL